MSAASPTIAHAGWLHSRPVERVMAALSGAPGECLARFVGGCVRNELLGVPVDDIDIATSLTPEAVMERARAAGIAAVPTGLKHGTVTLVANGRPVEVTTLRVDVATDGRRADVAFTEDWAADAARRDFTVNALYADAAGAVFDPVGGLADLAARRIRFIGDATARIREDYLRILRFFRFHAWYGRGEMDTAGLAAVRAERQGLTQLSAERVWKELAKLLGAPDPRLALAAMDETGVLTQLLPEAAGLGLFGRLWAVEEASALAPDPIRRLAALLPADAGLARALAARLRMSNEEAKALHALLSRGVPPDFDDPERAVKSMLYALGRQGTVGRLALFAAEAADPARLSALLPLAAEKMAIPVFPVKGQDLIDLGVPAGPEIGARLGALEKEWVASGFSLTGAELRARLKGR